MIAAEQYVHLLFKARHVIQSDLMNLGSALAGRREPAQEVSIRVIAALQVPDSRITICAT